MLTDIQVRNAKHCERPKKLFDSRGLYLHIMPNGGRYWRFEYRFNGRKKTLALGVYPDVPPREGPGASPACPAATCRRR